MSALVPCRQLPVTVTRIEWVATPVLHYRQWRLEIDLQSDASEVRAAAMLLAGDRLWHTRGWADKPNVTVTYAMDLFPWDWRRCDLVQINIGTGIHHNVVVHNLKHEPQAATRLLVQVGERVSTGAVLPLFRFDELDWTAQVALIARSDTKNVQTRWHIKTPLEDPGPYAYLATGRRSGFVALTPEQVARLAT